MSKKHYYYQEMKTKEKVYDYEAEDYVMEKLGLTITPLGKGGTLTELQMTNKLETVEWFFSGNWIKCEDKEVF